jgi:exo-1,4-beta-D-glucosaminidase
VIHQRLRASAAACAVVGLLALGTVPASADTMNIGPDWQVQSSAKVADSGDAVSRPGYEATGWLPVHNDDGDAPGTEMAARVNNGVYGDVFHSCNMANVVLAPNTNCTGLVDYTDFDVPWWFRSDFTLHPRAGERTTLVTHGLLPGADIWLNGHNVAPFGDTIGGYARYEWDVTDLLREGQNSIALRFQKNDADAYLTTDTVDWNQNAPDALTGSQFPIQLRTTRGVEVDDVHVVQDNASDMSTSDLTVKATLRNATDASQVVKLDGRITQAQDEGARTFDTETLLAPHETRTISFDSDAYPSLLIRDPHVWWPYQMGDQPLYRLELAADAGGQSSEAVDQDFGIRTVTSFLTPSTAMAPFGARQFVINGKPFAVRGGGWSEDLFFRYDRQHAANQIAVMKSMGIQTIRTEGKDMPDDWYEQLDRAGMLVMAGWTCCNRWEPGATTWTEDDYRIAFNSTLTAARRLRNHPSVFTFYVGSDNQPNPLQEQTYLSAFSQADWETPIVAAAEYKRSPQLGWSGSKEGPYGWSPPAYWWDNTHRTGSETANLTSQGGSWLLDTEQGPGHTMPTRDSLNRFLTPAEQAKMVDCAQPGPTPNPNQPGGNPPSATSECWMFHTDTSTNYRHLSKENDAINKRYGQITNIDDLVKKWQLQNYEDHRALFEAVIGHSKVGAPLTPSTGTVYWQMNKGWPSLLWILFGDDYDLMGTYFGAKEAQKPLHALWNYPTGQGGSDGQVAVDNLTGSTQRGLSLTSKVYDLSGRVLDTQTASGLSLSSQGVRYVLTPQVPTAPADSVYFVELTLSQDGAPVDHNVYWYSTTPDVVTWPSSAGAQNGANMTQYANLKALRTLPKARVSMSATTAAQPDQPNGADRLTSVTLTNTSSTSTVALMLRADVRRGSASGTPDGGDDQVLPTTWSDNDITLWPGQSQTIVASYRSADLRGRSPVVSLTGWNLDRGDAPAPPGPEGEGGTVQGNDAAPLRADLGPVASTARRPSPVASAKTRLRGRRVTITVACRGQKGAVCRGTAVVTARVRGRAGDQLGARLRQATVRRLRRQRPPSAPLRKTIRRIRYAVPAGGRRTLHATLPRAVKRRLVAHSVVANLEARS